MFFKRKKRKVIETSNQQDVDALNQKKINIFNPKLYAIKDTLVGFGGIGETPDIINLPNDEVALRVVKGSCAKGMKPNALNINANYKELWCVGEFDRTTGTITPCTPYCVAKCKDYVEGEVIVDDQPSDN